VNAPVSSTEIPASPDSASPDSASPDSASPDSASPDGAGRTSDPVGGLVVGPVQRYADESSVTVWVEVVRPGTVTVRAGDHVATARTFTAHDHHYALVDVTGLAPGSHLPYEVLLDDDRIWPPPRSLFPPSALRTLDLSSPVRIVFGTCRASVPHDRRTNRRYGIDVLRALALRLASGGLPEPAEGHDVGWPSLLLFLGDQVYADETSNAMREYISHQRDIEQEPGEELANFGEYAHLYRLSWTEPTVRWALSTLPSAMMFDDHDVRDDWNTSHAWREKMRATAWWKGRIVAGLSSYWIYQHLGNLSPAERGNDPVWQQVCAAGDQDVGTLLDSFGAAADDNPEAYRWSYRRDLGRNRLVVIDSRAGRVTEPANRAILDHKEVKWLDAQLTGDFDHLLIATSVPCLVAMGLHHVESWNEAVVAGAWGQRASGRAEQLRQAFDLEHWAAFQRTFRQVQQMVAEVASGGRGEAPATVLFLSGDVHHSYLVEGDLPSGPGQSRVLQAVCSPIRNPLPQVMRFVTATLAYGVAGTVGRVLARSARVAEPPWTWRVVDGPWFDNALATLDLDGRQALLAWETAREGPSDDHLLWCPVARTQLV